jgi:hypothetical protein
VSLLPRAGRPGRAAPIGAAVPKWVACAVLAGLTPVALGCPGASPASLAAATSPTAALTADVRDLERDLRERGARVESLEQELARARAEEAAARGALEALMQRLEQALAAEQAAREPLARAVESAGLGAPGAEGLAGRVGALEEARGKSERDLGGLGSRAEGLAARLEELARRHEDTARRLADLGERAGADRARFERDLDKIVQAIRIHTDIPNVNLEVPKIDGRVLAIEEGPEGPRLLLSVGARDGVKEHYEFQVRQGDRLVAKILVLEVDEGFSNAIIRRRIEGEIRPGDQVTTRS